MNFMVALLIADEATKRLGVKHEVQASLTGCAPEPATSWLEGNSVVHSNGISVTLDAGYNWDDSSVRIVRVGDGWGEPVTMKGWELCAEADRRAKSGEDVKVRVQTDGCGVFEYLWDQCKPKPFQFAEGEFGPEVMQDYTVQWRTGEYQDVTAEVIEWWAGQVKEGLK